MSPLDGDCAALLSSQSPTPIAQLDPDLSDQSQRVIRGEVTITWPYSTVTKTFAFLLAEPDVRLRRAKGQVRIELRGSSAKAASECGIGAGDELLLSLDGVEWANDESPGRIPGSRVDWQLRFNERLALQVKSAESGKLKHINIDHPEADPPTEPVAEARTTTPEPVPIVPDVQSAVRKIPDFAPNEYPSPAFVKRARLSYGALFEGGFDIFEEDGGAKGRGRKRTRFGRDSNAWRYTSQSPSPEPASPARDAMDEDIHEDLPAQPSPKPQMMDESCQAVEIPTPEAASEQVDINTPANPQEKTSPLPESPTPVSQEDTATLAQERPSPTPEEKGVSVTSGIEGGVRSDGQEGWVSARDDSKSTPQPMSPERSDEPLAADGTIQATKREPQQPDYSPAKSAETFSTSLFGTTKPSSSVPSLFGTGGPAGVESAFGIADRVRFGFSHIPDTTRPHVAPQNNTVPDPDHDEHDAYPVSYLDDQPASNKDPGAATYPNTADKPGEMAVQGEGIAPEALPVEYFGQGQWEMSTHSQDYNPVEGGHFGADALVEGARVPTGQSPLHTNEVAPGDVPAGFASYGQAEIPKGSPEGSPHHVVSREDQTYIENEGTISGDEVAVDDEEDKDAEYDEYTYGERIEEGDYDQRNYDAPSDDDEGLSEEEDEITQEAGERYGDGEMYDEDDDKDSEDDEDDEDGEGDYWNEDEEEYDEEEYDESEEDEDGYDMEGYQQQPLRKPTAPAPPSEPVVISLLSDSEDDDESAPTPSKSPVASQAAPAQHTPELFANPKSSAESKAQTPSDASELKKSAATVPGPEDRQLHSSIFGQTHVVDFGIPSHGIGTQLKATVVEMDSGPEASSSTSQGAGSPKTAVTQTHLHTLEIESAPSEASSEGLFITQPRPEYLEAEDERVGDGSGSEEDDVEEASGVEEPHPQHVKALDSDGSLTDDDDSSFASQVEMSQELEVAEDEDLMEEVAAEAQDSAGAAQPNFEIEEVSDEDVDMIDVASAHSETVPQDSQLSQDTKQEGPGGLPEPIPPAVVGAASDAAVVADIVGDFLPDAPTAEQEAEIPPSAANEQETGVAEPADKASTVMRKHARKDTAPSKPISPPVQSLKPGTVKHEVPPLAAQGASHPASKETQELSSPSQSDGKNQDESTIQEPTSPTNSVFQQSQLASSGPSAQGSARNVHALSAESRREVNEDQTINGDVISDTQDVRSPEGRAVTETWEGDKAIPNSSPLGQSYNVDMGEAASEEQPATLSSSQAEQGQHEQSDIDKADLAQQSHELAVSQRPNPPAKGAAEEHVIMQEQSTQEEQLSQDTNTLQAQSKAQSPSPDISIYLARQTVASRRSKKAQEPKKAPEPLRTSPRLTRGRSNSLQTNTTPERDEGGDNSVSLARAALTSPSKIDGSAPPTTATTTTTTTTTAALKSELTKRLRTDLPECVPLRNLRLHNERFPNVVAVVTTHPTPAVRAKGGPREFFMSFHVTDPSAAPTTVVEVQLYRPHKDSLPVVKPGDAVLLQRFQVKSLSKKGWGLRTQGESAWAVFEDDGAGSGGGAGSGEGEGKDGSGVGSAPQIKGPPVEDYEGYMEYVGLLKRWFRGLMSDATAREKLERADKKLTEAGRGGGGGSGK
ncbi:hypothetical protein MMYC01_205371 [Madurella mycetomatis]|uniref:Telomeric single stranded DNA binding POT1/Cdc13 domain-containing protein n=1 Tax=Madurella mycetomatis TaxID=100816 RepID=A0A175W298_9PEZI|nr:hypothetical protein MMYC01_205371 [Madurella mycetomatis]